MTKRISKSAVPFQQFKHWWKIDNPEWVAQRKNEWATLKKKSPAFDHWSAQELSLIHI